MVKEYTTEVTERNTIFSFMKTDNTISENIDLDRKRVARKKLIKLSSMTHQYCIKCSRSQKCLIQYFHI